MIEKITLPFSSIERQLDKITMYRVVLYALAAIAVYAFGSSIADVLFASVGELAASLVVLLISTLGAHYGAKRLTGAPANVESSLITALILFLILPPSTATLSLFFTAVIGAGSIFLKYIIQYRFRHIFNPVALILVIAGVTGMVGADWWVGSRYLLPIVALTGILVIMKTRRFTLFTTYLIVSTLVAVLFKFYITGLFDGFNIPVLLDTAYLTNLSEAASSAFKQHFLSWPTIFFATIMLTEPLGLPSTKKRQIVYASIAAVLANIYFSFGPISSTPEFALLIANMYTFVMERPGRLILSLHSKKIVGHATVEYFFSPSYTVNHRAGQYLEWTLPHSSSDSRGVRRYLSISSPPEADLISFTVRHVENGSSWKEKLKTLETGELLYATQCAGDFYMRPNAKRHVFIAGGIGVTPFMSMIREALQDNIQLPATLLYCNRNDNDIAFSEELNRASLQIGLSVMHVLEEPSTQHKSAIIGRLTKKSLQKLDLAGDDTHFYISGPPGMVGAYSALLKDLGIPSSHIFTDYFPGLA